MSVFSDLDLHPVTESFPDYLFILNKEGVIKAYQSPDKENMVFKQDLVRKNIREFLPSEAYEAVFDALTTTVGKKKTTSFGFAFQSGKKLLHFEGRFSPIRESNEILMILRNISIYYDIEVKKQNINELHRIIAQCSSRLIQSNYNQISESIRFSIAKLGGHLGLETVVIYDYNAETDVLYNSFQWCSDHVTPFQESNRKVAYSQLPHWREKFSLKEPVRIAPDEPVRIGIRQDAALLGRNDKNYFFAVPMFSGDSFIGFTGFESCPRISGIIDQQSDLLSLFGEIMAGSISRERSERELSEAKYLAEKANKAKSEFFASISHEIRTPINAILGFSEILFNNAEDATQKDYLSAVLSSGRTLLNLINDLLDLSKIEAGQMEILEVPSRISDIFRDTAKIFSTDVAEKKLEFRITLPDKMPEVIRVDELRLRQILFNLVGNAIKFTNTGYIELKAAIEKNEDKPEFVDLNISVADTGIGIPASYQGIIFNAFVQVETNNSRQHGGTGLGLAITQRLVQLMNGTLSLESQVNKGSVFTISLKDKEIMANPGQMKNVFEWFNKVITFEPSVILVVDDIAFNRQLVKGFLNNFNFRVIEASNGPDGIQMALQHRPDLILMDLRMPKMNGYQVVEKLRSIPETRNINCIAFTASTMRQDDDLIKQVFDGFLMKPITRNEMIDCLMKFLPHQISDPDGMDDAGKELPAFNLTEIITQTNLVRLRRKLNKEVLPDIQKLLLYLDSDVIEHLVNRMDEIVLVYKLSNFAPTLNKLKSAAERFDYEIFTKEIMKLEGHIKQILAFK